MEPILTQVKNALSWVVILIAAVSCSDDSGTKADTRALLLRSWTLDDTGYVMKDDVDVTDSYTGLTMTFMDNSTYITAAGGMLLKPSGSWDWASAGTSQITMDGDFPVYVEALTKNTLKLRFTMDIDHANSGRAQEVLGEFEIVLTATE
jgi:hypothetical protein